MEIGDAPMEVSVYRLTPEGLEPFERDKAVAAWRSGDGVYWVDTVGGDETWRKRILADVGASEFLQKAVEDRRGIASVVTTGNAVYFQIPALVENPDDSIEFLHGLAVPNGLITWRSHPIVGIDNLVEGLSSPTDLPFDGTTSELVALLCARLSTEAYRASQELRHQMDAMSNVERPDGGFDEDELSAAGRALQAIDEVAGDYRQVFASLRDSRSSALDLSGHHSPMQVALNNAKALSRRVDLYYARLTQMHRIQDRVTDDKTNRRLGLLSVVSAIFLPLTLLTGIYGMNFEHMPSLEWWWAYPLLLILMLVIGISLWRYFKHNNWF
jgi:Mg2+ and Co2+ transporter CorA